MKNKNESKLICSKCKKKAKSLHGNLGSTYMLCDNCFVPEENLPNFEYIPEGKTMGRIKIPTERCGVCGRIMIQPTPVAIWTHGRNAEDEGSSEEQDHIPRIATLLELLMFENKREENWDYVAHWRYYGDSRPVHKERYVQCLIHRKYWLKANEKETRITGGYHLSKNWKEYVKYFIEYSERNNAKKFEKFLLVDNQILKTNPSEPQIFFEFYIIKGRGINKTANLIKIMNKDEIIYPVLDSEIKIDRKNYIVSSISQPSIINSDKKTIKVYLGQDKNG